MTQPAYLYRGKTFHYPNIVNVVDGDETSDWPSGALIDTSSLHHLSLHLEVTSGSGIGVGLQVRLEGSNLDDTSAQFVALSADKFNGSNPTTGTNWGVATYSGDSKLIITYKDLPRFVRLVATPNFIEGSTGTAKVHLYGWTV